MNSHHGQPSVASKPFYSPPYDSEIEEIFARYFLKHKAGEVDFYPQYPVSTNFGKFKLDFVVQSKAGRLIGIECDGRDWHETGRDEWRDSLILAASQIQIIYRFPGSALNFAANECMYFLQQLEPTIFSKRGALNLETLVGMHCQKFEVKRGESIRRLPFPPNEDGIIENGWFMTQHFLALPEKENRHRNSLVEFSKEQPQMPLDDLISTYLSRRRLG